MSCSNDVTVLILSGGNSTRWGSDKAQFPILGETLLQRTINTVHPHFSQVLLSTSTKGEYAEYSIQIVPDEIQGQGPVIGLLSGFRVAINPLVWVVACDQIGIKAELARNLYRSIGKADVIVPHHESGELEPLAALYKRDKSIEVIEDLLAVGDRRVDHLFNKLKTKYYRLHPNEEWVNLNTKEDLNAAIRKLDIP